MKKGRFIVIEGGEGSGKTTMVKLAKELLPNAVVTREPGGAPFAEKIREIILSPDAKNADANTQFGLFWAARADHMKNTVIPALMNGKDVITDRFDSSSYAYQIFGQENKHLKDLFMKVREVYLGQWVPNMYVFLNVDPKEGVRRRATQKGYDVNHFDERAADFHDRVMKGYMEFFKTVPHMIVDANQQLELVKEDFKKALQKIVIH